MRKIFPLLSGCCVAILLNASCKKQQELPEGASFTIVNAIVGSEFVRTNTQGTTPIQWYNSSPSINYNSFSPDPMRILSYGNPQVLGIYNEQDTLASKGPMLLLNLALPAGSINSLFLTGTESNPDTLFTVDKPPYHSVTDSVAGFRFVNLSPGSAPIQVNILGEANGSTVSSLAYKGITEFKTFSAVHDVSSISFEFRDAATGTLLGSFTATDINLSGSDYYTSRNFYRFRNCTLALTGLPGGTGMDAQQVIKIDN